MLPIEFTKIGHIPHMTKKSSSKKKNAPALESARVRTGKEQRLFDNLVKITRQYIQGQKFCAIEQGRTIQAFESAGTALANC